jgi:hypothetical protein
MKKAILLTRIFLPLFLMLLCGSSYCQELDNNVRPAFDLKLFVNDSTFYQAHMDATFYVIKERTIQIFPGEKIYVEADLSGDILVNLRVVPEIKNKEKTITISFLQEHDGNNHVMMKLNLVNPFPQNLLYSARINLMKQKRWVGTSVEPVMPKIMSLEMWPDIITTIVLYNFYLKKPD